MKPYLEERIAACRQKEAALVADSRADEAVFEKIRANVYEIFLTIWNMGRGEDFFREKLEAIPKNWQAAYDRAKTHEDIAAMTLEIVKLDTAKEIMEEWEARA